MFFCGVPVWGHRGWPTRHPDNTLAGIEAAAGVAAGVEIDVRRLRDGRLVLSHDADLVGHVVAESAWEELAGLDVGDGHHPCLLDHLAGLAVPIDLEVKQHPLEPGFETDHRTALEVAAWAREGDVVTSFWWPAMDAVRADRPSVSTGLLVDRDQDAHVALDHAARIGHGTIAPHHSAIDRRLVGAAHAERVAVVAWTVDTADEALRLAEMAVDAIITNRPGELIAEAPITRDCS